MENVEATQLGGDRDFVNHILGDTTIAVDLLVAVDLPVEPDTAGINNKFLKVECSLDDGFHLVATFIIPPGSGFRLVTTSMDRGFPPAWSPPPHGQRLPPGHHLHEQRLSPGVRQRLLLDADGHGDHRAANNLASLATGLLKWLEAHRIRIFPRPEGSCGRG